MAKSRPDIFTPKKEPKVEPKELPRPIHWVFNTHFARNNDAFTKAAIIGPTVAIAMYLPDSLAFKRRTGRSEATFLPVGDKKGQIKYKGLGTSIFKQTGQLTCTFAFCQAIEDSLNNINKDGEFNEKTAKAVGAFGSKLLFYPVSTVEGLRYLGYSWEDIFSRPMRAFYSGALASSASSAISFPTMLFATEQLKPYIGPAFAGAAGSVVAATLSSPFGVISDVQKEHPQKNIVETAKSLYAEGRFPRFFRGLTPQLIPAATFGIGFGYLYTHIQDAIQERDKSDAEKVQCRPCKP